MRASRQLLTILLLATLATAALGTASAVAAPAPNSAVVFVSGFTTTTPFTSSAAVCAGREGPTWGASTGAPALLRSAGYAVFTAPVANHGDAAAPCAAPGAPVPPASATIDSNGDVDANGRALLVLLQFLRTSYGITNVQLVGHSDGGLWSRSALTQQPATTTPQPQPSVQSLTTLGTPHTGSFGADLAIYVNDGACDTSGLLQEICDLMLPELQALVADLGVLATTELTSSYLAGWNAQQTIGCPVTVIAGTYVSLPSWIGWAVPAYYFPNDGIVGEASGLNQASMSLTAQQIPAAPFQTVSGGTYPVVHSPTVATLLGTTETLTNDPAIATAVQSSIATPPGTAPCAAGSAAAAAAQGSDASAPSRASGAGTPGAAAAVAAAALPRTADVAAPSATAAEAAARPRVQRARFATLLAPDAQGRIAARPRDVALLRGGARVTCGDRRLSGVPLLGSRRLRFTVLPTCRGGVTVRGGRALVVRRDQVARSLELRVSEQRLNATVRGDGLRDVRVQARLGGRWRAVTAAGRALEPLAAPGGHLRVRAIGRDAQGRRFVATAHVAR